MVSELTGGSGRILIIDDDDDEAEAIRTALEHERFAVARAADGSSGLALFEQLHPDAVLLEERLPGLSGLDVCRAIRGSGSTVAIIMISKRSDELDVVVAMELGADDFLAKPYKMRVLVARLRALLRRAAARRPVTASPLQPCAAPRRGPEAGAAVPVVLVVDDLELDKDRHEARKRGELVELTPLEFRLLEELMRRAGKLLPRKVLLQLLWGPDFAGDGKILSTLINRLRGRIEDDPEHPKRITTVRGLGYRYEYQRKPSPKQPESLGPAADEASEAVYVLSPFLIEETGTAPVDGRTKSRK